MTRDAARLSCQLSALRARFSRVSDRRGERNQETLEIDASAEDRIHPVHRLGSISFRAVDVTVCRVPCDGAANGARASDETVRLDISASYITSDVVQELSAPIFC